jgi:MoaA/NifB/PqqE/SkfB family radical SAM enzyme
MIQQLNEDIETKDISLDFVWLELTNQCNLKCTHCYADSGPRGNVADLLQRVHYEKLILDSHQLGCRHIQFIGGEPTLNPDLPYLIHIALAAGYSSIEVFTNLISLPASLQECFVTHNVSVATSVYAPAPAFHDRVTQVDGSFERTTKNIASLLNAGVPVRAGVIDVENDSERVDATVSFLKGLGVHHVGVDRLRLFGRAKDRMDTCLSELCGSCAGNILCIGPDGRVSPCIMSKDWSVGSVLKSSLREIASSTRLAKLRTDIHHAAGQPTHATYHLGACNPDRPNKCGPDYGGPCSPCNPNTHCGPNSCKPVR